MLKGEPVPSVNMLSVGAIVNGDIIVDGDLRIDGKVTGNISCDGKILIGSAGYIDGTIKCTDAEISGEIKGNIVATGLIILKETSKLTGMILTDKLIIESGAILNLENCKTGTEI